MRSDPKVSGQSVVEPTVRGGPVVSFYRPRQTELARRRRLVRLVRELADDLGFDRVTLAERSALKQLATLNLQIEIMQEAIIRGEALDSDELIRLTSEARRMLNRLRRRVTERRDQVSVPLRERLMAEPVG